MSPNSWNEESEKLTFSMLKYWKKFAHNIYIFTGRIWNGAGLVETD